MALEYHNELVVRVIDPKPAAPIMHVIGEGALSLPRDKRNIIFSTMAWLFKKAQRPMPALELGCMNRIPLARGLGSSSAAFVSALVAANHLLKDRFSKNELLSFATELEGHPDNVAPALLGGVRASAVIGKQVLSISWAAPKCDVVVAVPAFQLSTKKARAVLPREIPMQDAVWNLSAVSLLSHALTEDLSLLKSLLNDRWHEPYRAKLIPGFSKVKKAALQQGAFGVILSGAGPTMLSFVAKNKRSRVANAMKNTFARAGVESRVMSLAIDNRGATVQ
jgi:homoserine kinase